MQYLQKDVNYSGAVRDQIRMSRVRFSHLLLHGKSTDGTAHSSSELIADLKKIIINSALSGFASQKKNITDVSLWDFINVSDMSGGVGYSATDLSYRALIPLGDYNLQDSDMIFDVASSSNLTKQLSFRMVALRLGDGIERVEYLKRPVPTDGVHFARVLQLYDVDVNATEVKSLLSFENGTQAEIRHHSALELTQAVSRIESVNTYGCVYSDKDIEEGRAFKIEPSAAFNALAIQYSTLN